MTAQPKIIFAQASHVYAGGQIVFRDVRRRLEAFSTKALLLAVLEVRATCVHRWAATGAHICLSVRRGELL